MRRLSPDVSQRHSVFDGEGRLLAELEGTAGAVLREYVWLDSIPVAMVTGAASPAYSYITTAI